MRICFVIALYIRYSVYCLLSILCHQCHNIRISVTVTLGIYTVYECFSVIDV